MARRKKNSKPRTFRIRNDVLERLYKYSEETGIPMTTIVDRALEMYLDAKENIQK